MPREGPRYRSPLTSAPSATCAATGKSRSSPSRSCREKAKPGGGAGLTPQTPRMSFQSPTHPLEAVPSTAHAPLGAPPLLLLLPLDYLSPPPTLDPLGSSYAESRLHSLLLRLQRHLVSPQSRHVPGSERLLGSGTIRSRVPQPQTPPLSFSGPV